MTNKTSIIVQNLISQIEVLDQDIALKQIEKKSIAEKVDRLKAMGESVELCREKGIGESRIGVFLEDFLEIGKQIYEREDYIKYKYSTAVSEQYFKIERKLFESYIERYAKTDLKSFLELCIYLKLIKTEQVGRKCRSTYTSGNKTVYYVSKAYIDASAYVLQED